MVLRARYQAWVDTSSVVVRFSLGFRLAGAGPVGLANLADRPLFKTDRIGWLVRPAGPGYRVVGTVLRPAPARLGMGGGQRTARAHGFLHAKVQDDLGTGCQASWSFPALGTLPLVLDPVRLDPERRLPEPFPVGAAKAAIFWVLMLSSVLRRAVRHTPFQNSLKPSLGAPRPFPTAGGFEKGYDTRFFPTKTEVFLLQEHHQ